MNKTVPIIGFLILTAMTLAVFGFATYEAWNLQPVGGIIGALVVLGLLYTVFKESQGLAQVKAGNVFSRRNILSFAAVVAGSLISYTLNHNLRLGSVLGAALVGLVGAVVLPDYAGPLYTGSFAGMASAALLVSHPQIALAGVIAGILYVITQPVLGGFGGKPGAIAAVGCVVAGVCLNRQFSHPDVPKWALGQWLVVYSIIATIATYYLNNQRKHGPVMASSVIGLVGGVLLPALYPDIGKTLAVMVICASFAGTSSDKRFPTIVPMFFVGLITALVYIYSMPFIGGAGGKLGAIAFGSVMAVRGFMDFAQRLGGAKTTA